jgi:hypothetical protein
VALSAGCVEICRKRERRAEKSVGGEAGIGVTGMALRGVSGVDETEGFRSGLRRTGTKEGGGTAG